MIPTNQKKKPEEYQGNSSTNHHDEPARPIANARGEIAAMHQEITARLKPDAIPSLPVHPRKIGDNIDKAASFLSRVGGYAAMAGAILFIVYLIQ